MVTKDNGSGTAANCNLSEHIRQVSINSNQQQQLASCSNSNKNKHNDDDDEGDEKAGASSRRSLVGCHQQMALDTSDEYVTASEESVSTINGSVNNSSTISTTGKQLTLTPSVDETKRQMQNNSSQPSKQNLLTRGKQQRASISSCSSSDSYASYGSGYASGSGNSTDHEHKQRSNKPANAEDDLHVVNDDIKRTVTNGNEGRPDDDGDDDDDEETDNDSQLKQHLSELEQLTDELANRNIFGSSLDQPLQSTSKHQVNINTTTSTILSNSVENELSSNIMQHIEEGNDEGSPRARDGSRSTSATPTSTNQQVKPKHTQTSSNSFSSPYSALDTNGDSGDMTSLNHHASKLNHQLPSESSPTAKQTSAPKQEQYYHNLFQWEQLVSKGVTRPLLINDLDFTDLRDEDDCDLLTTSQNNQARTARNQLNNGEPLTINIPANQLGQDNVDGSGYSQRSAEPSTPASAPPPMPPPPISPWFNTISGSRPQSQLMSSPSPTYEYPNGQQDASSSDFNRAQSPTNSTYSSYSRNSICLPQSSTPKRDSFKHQFNTMQPISSLRSASSMSSLLFGNNAKYANKRKKTMKLFWKEVREDRSLLAKLTKKKTIWDEIKPVQVDTQKLAYLFESKAKDLSLSKSRSGLDGLNQRKVKITVLDAKRSNAINIGMTKLPPMRTIKSAILKMDSSIMNREGIEKILTTMMPSEEEKSRIIEAQLANPDTPLGTAEQFLLNLASISALEARLKLWAFQLDYAQIEKEVAEPLMDLKQAIEEIEGSETFRVILGTLLAIGNFLNSTNAKGFQIDYLEKVPEVKDTVHKHSLLHHLCLFIQEKYDPQLTSDLYSEFSAVNRASKVDYTEVAKNLKKMQLDCKASWDYLKIVAKHDGLANLMNTCGVSSSSSDTSSSTSPMSSQQNQQPPKSSGKLNNLSKLSMITTIMSSDSTSLGLGSNSMGASDSQQSSSNGKQLKIKVSDFLTDCAERIMVLMVIHRRVMNRFQKLLVYLGCPSQQIKQTQPQQILKVINEFALEYRTKRERVKEMLMKKQQCMHHNHHLHQPNQNAHVNRWQMNRSRWAGSQQCLDSLGYNQGFNRPCSTTSSCTSSIYGGAGNNCCELMYNLSSSSNKSSHNLGNLPRPGSPSGCSQISNYSDFLFDQSSCCNSRQQSMTPVPALDRVGLNNSCPATTASIATNGNLGLRPHSMSASMYNLQNQQNGANNGDTCQQDNVDQTRLRDEQLRRLLGAGKSLEGACGDLYQMSHWSSTMARVTRHPQATKGPLQAGHKQQRAASMEASGADNDACNNNHDIMSGSRVRQSSYYRYLRHGRSVDESEQNSDDEILQSLVRTATARGGHNSNGADKGSNGPSGRRLSSDSSHISRDARGKLLSRFNCERKSFRRTLRGGIELSNVG